MCSARVRVGIRSVWVRPGVGWGVGGSRVDFGVDLESDEFDRFGAFEDLA